MNLPVGAECFIPSVNTVVIGGAFGSRDLLLLAETYESIAVLESRKVSIRIVGSPKPANPVFYALSITHKKMVPLVLVKVCEFVHFAFYHIKNYRESALSRFVISATFNIAASRRRSHWFAPYLCSDAGVWVVPILSARSSEQFWWVINRSNV